MSLVGLINWLDWLETIEISILSFFELKEYLSWIKEIYIEKKKRKKLFITIKTVIRNEDFHALPIAHFQALDHVFRPLSKMQCSIISN